MTEDYELQEDSYFDARAIRKKSLIHWSEYWNHQKPIGAALLELLSQIIWLPESDLQLPIVAAYLMCNTRVAQTSGYLFHYGKPQTGKSRIITLASRILGISPLLANSSGVAMRNLVNSLRYQFDDAGKPIYSNTGIQKEKDGCFLLIDNLSEKNLIDNEYCYQLLLGGYDIDTSIIAIGDKGGKNITFSSFGFKILSSIHPLHLSSQLTEIRGRLFTIKHDSMPSDFKPVIVSKVRWDGLKELYLSHWNQESVDRYCMFLNGSLSTDSVLFTKWSEEKNQSPRRWDISTEVIASGLISGIFESPEQGVEHFLKYFEYIDSDNDKKDSSTKQICQEIIDSLVLGQIEIKIAQGKEDEAKKIKMQPNLVKELLDKARADGRLDITPTPEKISQIFLDLGWKLTRKGWIQV